MERMSISDIVREMLAESYIEARRVQQDQIAELGLLLQEFGFTFAIQNESPVMSERFNLMSSGPMVSFQEQQRKKDVSMEAKRVMKLTLTPEQFKIVQAMVQDAPFAYHVVKEAEREFFEKLVKQGYAYRAGDSFDVTRFPASVQRVLKSRDVVFLGDRMLVETQPHCQCECEMCKGPVGFGLQCRNTDCGKLVHWWCFSERNCPFCNTPYGDASAAEE